MLIFLFPSVTPAQNATYRAFLNTMYSRFDVAHIPCDTLQQAMQSKAPVILDTRSADEFAVSHLQGARFVGFDDFNVQSVKELPKDEPIVVYCSVGYRSSVVAETLKAAGYTNVRNLYGGIFAWINSGWPVYRSGQATDEIHPYDGIWGMWLTRGTKRTRVDD